MTGPVRSAWLLVLGLVWAGCVSDGHPLGKDGSVEVRMGVDGPLFATDSLDEEGNASGPRQVPFSSDVLLRITEDTEVGHGAYVSVHVEPAEALVLGSANDVDSEGATHENGAEPTCALIDGAFQCRANLEGAARFSVTSKGDWSGDAFLVVSWANQRVEKPVRVSPAGLPEEATNFRFLGITEGERIAPTYLELDCTVDALPEDLGDKWPEGRIRSREVFVRASPPADQPTVIENAPVIVEALNANAAFSVTADCEERTTRLRLLLDERGESDRFFACFSDLGGDVAFGVSSGEKVLDDPPTVEVVAEPRLLRVRVLDGQSSVPVDFSPQGMFEVAAYDVTLSAVPLDVDLSIAGSGSGVLVLSQGSATLAPEGAQPAVISAIPNQVGEARLVVTPRLLSSPQCQSENVTVTP